MGYAVAQAAVQAGHTAVLVAGPTQLPDPIGIKTLHVTSTQQMRDAVLSRLDGADIVVGAAAPCDFRPAECQTHKVKKKAGQLVLTLIPTPDALAEAGQRKGRRVLIGFAMEVRNGRRNALDKLTKKNLDAIVLNAPKAFAGETTSATILKRDGTEEDWRHVEKADLARRLVALAEELWETQCAPTR